MATTNEKKLIKRKPLGPKQTVSDIPYPENMHGNEYEDYKPTGFAAVIPEGVQIAQHGKDQEFALDPEKLEFLVFEPPGKKLPDKKQYTIKALHRDGRLVQLGFEPQIENNVAGDPQDGVGLRRAERKGIYLFLDWATMIPVYCAAWGCWAQSTKDTNYAAFCCLAHAQHTLPNRYKGAGQIQQGLMEAGVTTSRTWSV